MGLFDDTVGLFFGGKISPKVLRHMVTSLLRMMEEDKEKWQYQERNDFRKLRR